MRKIIAACLALTGLSVGSAMADDLTVRAYAFDPVPVYTEDGEFLRDEPQASLPAPPVPIVGRQPERGLFAIETKAGLIWLEKNSVDVDEPVAIKTRVVCPKVQGSQGKDAKAGVAMGAGGCS